MTDTKKANKKIERPPVIAVLGHIDHGKSTILDYIRKSNVVDQESGGITQHISAYEVVHKTADGKEKKITFLDTPGHEAFQAQRKRGAHVADVAVLVVSAEDGVKAQTLEALKATEESGIPFLVAINKVDSPKANVEKTLGSLSENKVFLEGRGGSVPYVEVSAKTGKGIEDLLEMILLVAEVEELKADPNDKASGVIVEAHRDSKRGISCTLIIQDGTLRSGMFVVSGNSMAPVRIMEDQNGNRVEEATFSSPVKIVGWDDLPKVGDEFSTVENRKEAEQKKSSKIETKNINRHRNVNDKEHEEKMPLIIKADALGSIDAIMHEVSRLSKDSVKPDVIYTGVGNITESDVKSATGNERTKILGFNTNVDGTAKDLAERDGVTIETFEIIYKLSEWLEKELEKARPTKKEEEVRGSAKILKAFSRTKKNQVLGGKVTEGKLKKGDAIRIMRRGEKIENGTILELQIQRSEAKEVQEGAEFGAKVGAATEIVPGDEIEAISIRREK